MSDYSKAPGDALDEARKQGYTGIHVEQGVPILDRDLNLMHDLLASGMQSMLSRYIGDGIPDTPGEAFAIRSLPEAGGQSENNFQIVGPGACLVGGAEATITASTDYVNQPHAAGLDVSDHPSFPQPLTTPPAGGADSRHDVVYLDVFTIEVDGTPDLDNSHDVGMQTSVRIKTVWTVRVAENAENPPDPKKGHSHYPLARLLRRPGEARITELPAADGQPATQILDLRRRRLTVATLESRLSLLERVLFAPSLDPGPGQIRPRQGRANQPITLSGTNLHKPNTTVTFGGVQAQFADAPQSDTEITVKVPGGITLDGTPKNVTITVGNEIGTAVSDRSFLVLPAPVFAATSPTAPSPFAPTSGPPGTIVTLTGFNFTPGTPTVTFGGKTAVVQQDATYTELKAAVPDGLTGDVKIKIAFPDPRGSSEAASTFKVLPN